MSSAAADRNLPLSNLRPAFSCPFEELFMPCASCTSMRIVEMEEGRARCLSCGAEYDQDELEGWDIVDLICLGF